MKDSPPYPVFPPLDFAVEVDCSESAYDLLRALRGVQGSLDYDGDASLQVLLPLEGGGYLRVGITDADLKNDQLSIWADRYGGLPLAGSESIQHNPQMENGHAKV